MEGTSHVEDNGDTVSPVSLSRVSIRSSPRRSSVSAKVCTRLKCSPSCSLCKAAPVLVATPNSKRKLSFDDASGSNEAKMARLLEDGLPERPLSDGALVAQALSASATPTQLICREHERDTISSFLKEHIKKGVSGSLYVCGKPGTGKSATVNEILQAMSQELSVRSSISAMIYYTC